MFSIRRKTSNSRGRRNSNGIHETRAKFAKREQIRWARGRLSPGRSLIIDDGLMHPSHFIQDVRHASTTRRCSRSMFRSNKITDIQFTFKGGGRGRAGSDWPTSCIPGGGGGVVSSIVLPSLDNRVRSPLPRLTLSVLLTLSRFHPHYVITTNAYVNVHCRRSAVDCLVISRFPVDRRSTTSREIDRQIRTCRRTRAYVRVYTKSILFSHVYVHVHACEWDFYHTTVKMHTLIDNPDRFVACWHTNAICAIPVNPFPFAISKDSDRMKFGRQIFLDL